MQYWIIDPRTGDVHDFNGAHPFAEMPPALYKAFWWGVVRRHESISWDDPEVVNELIGQLSVPDGYSPKGRLGTDFFDIYTECGGPSWRDIPHMVTDVELDYYLGRLVQMKQRTLN